MPITGVAGSPWPYNPQAQNTPWSPPWGGTWGTPGNPYPWDQQGFQWPWQNYQPPWAQQGQPPAAGQPPTAQPPTAQPPTPYTPFTPNQLPVVGGAFPQGSQFPSVTGGQGSSPTSVQVGGQQPTVDGRTNALTGAMLDPSQPIQRIGPFAGGDTSQSQPSTTATGQGGAAAPATSATPAGGPASDVQKATIKQLQDAGLVKGDPVGTGAPEMQKDPNGLLPTSPTGNTIFTFGDGTTAVVGPNGEVGTVTPPVEKSATTLQNQAGVMSVGNQVWVKGSDGVWAQSTQSAATQQLADSKTSADTAYTQAQTDSINAKTALDNDPTNIQLQQDKQRADIAYQQAQITKSNADIAYQQGQLGVSQGNLAVNQGNLAISQAKAPGEIAQTAATTLSTQATAAETMRRAQEPTVVQSGTTAPYTTVWNPATGQYESQANPSYLPTDPGHMQIQLNQQMNDYSNQLQQQVQQGKMTPDAAAGQWNNWYSQNIEPMKGQIANASALQAIDQQQKAASAQYTQAQAGYEQFLPGYDTAQLAQTATDAAQRNAISMMPYTAGPGYGQQVGQLLSSMGTGKFPKIDPQAMAAATTFSLPNLQEIGRQGAAQALQYLSPTAAMHTQIPGPPTTPYMGGGMPQLGGIPAPPYNYGTGPYGSTQMPNYGGGGQLTPMGGGPGGLPTPFSAWPGGAPQQMLPQGGPPQSMLGAQGFNLMPTSALANMPPPGAMTSYTNPGLDMSMMPGYTPAM